MVKVIKQTISQFTLKFVSANCITFQERNTTMLWYRTIGKLSVCLYKAHTKDIYIAHIGNTYGIGILGFTLSVKINRSE